MKNLRKIFGVILILLSVVAAVFLFSIFRYAINPLGDCGSYMLPSGIASIDYNPCGPNSTMIYRIIGMGILDLFILSLGIFLLITESHKEIESQIRKPDEKITSRFKTYVKIFGIILVSVLLVVAFMASSLHILIDVNLDQGKNPTFNLGEQLDVLISGKNLSPVAVYYSPNSKIYLDGQILKKTLGGINLDFFEFKTNKLSFTLLNKESRSKDERINDIDDLIVTPGPHILTLEYENKKFDLNFSINESTYSNERILCNKITNEYRQRVCLTEEAEETKNVETCLAIKDNSSRNECYNKAGNCSNLEEKEERDICYQVQDFSDPNSCVGLRPAVKGGVDENYYETDYYCYDQVFSVRYKYINIPVQTCKQIEDIKARDICFEYLVSKKKLNNFCEEMQNGDNCYWSRLIDPKVKFEDCSVFKDIKLKNHCLNTVALDTEIEN